MNIVRLETPDDRDGVCRVIVEAFTASTLGHHGEADLVEELRNNCRNFLSLVAVRGDEVVGHIFFSPVSIRKPAGDVDGMGLAPMAVAPKHQRAGIGSALVNSGLERLAAAGCPFVVVLGHPDYYARFGFVPASQFEVCHGFNGLGQDVFFVNILNRSREQSIAQGTATYHPEFGPQDG